MQMASGVALAATRPTLASALTPRTFCLYSKHLPELDWRDLARAAGDAGFGGIDLTVRPRGHVLPERAAEDLPQAVEAITAQGLAVPMITTDLTSADSPLARPLLQAAARSGVAFFTTG
jgi:L-ribulose-5-phosphate 3-epimerase